MKKAGSLYTLILAAFFTVHLGGCNTNDAGQQEFARGIIEVQLLDAESGEPVPGMNVFVATGFEGDPAIYEQGWTVTDSEGSFEETLINTGPSVVDRLFFALEANGEIIEIEEEVELELRVEEPLERVALTLEI